MKTWVGNVLLIIAKNTVIIIKISKFLAKWEKDKAHDIFLLQKIFPQIISYFLLLHVSSIHKKDDTSFDSQCLGLNSRGYQFGPRLPGKPLYISTYLFHYPGRLRLSSYIFMDSERAIINTHRANDVYII